MIEWEHLKRRDQLSPDSALASQTLRHSLATNGHCLVRINDKMIETMEEGFKMFDYFIKSDGNNSEKRISGVKEWFDYQQGVGDEETPGIFRDAFTLLNEVGREAASSVARSLNLPSLHFDTILDERPLRPGTKSSSLLQIFRYEENERNNVITPDHVDKGLLTVIAVHPCSRGGLQFKEKSEWCSVEEEDCIVVLAGHLLEHATCGHIKAAKHRVVSVGGVERKSMAFKLRCRDDANIDFSTLEQAGLRVDDRYPKGMSVSEITKQFEEEHESVNKSIQLTPSTRPRKRPADSTIGPTRQSSAAKPIIIIGIKDYSLGIVHYKINSDSKLLKVFLDFAQKKDVELCELRFHLNDGKRVDCRESALHNGIEEGDVIDASPAQGGD